MLKTILRSGVLALAVCGMYCGSGAATAQNHTASSAAPQRYTDAAHHFSLVVPAGWIHAQRGMTVVFAGPKDGAFTPNFVVTMTMVTTATEPTLAQYTAEARQAIARMKTIKIVSDAATTLGGRPARAVLIQGTARGVAFVQRQVYCLRERQGFTLGATTAPVQTAKYNPTFDRMFSSFTWEK